MAEESLIPAETLAKWAGMKEEELYDAIKGTVKPEDGKYPATKAIRATLEHLRDLIDYIPGYELAELQELSWPRVSTQAKTGIIQQDGHGRYPRRKTVFDVIKYWKNRGNEGKTTAGGIKLESLKMDNETRKLALEKAKGNALSKKSVERGMAERIIMARQILLNIEPKMEQQFARFKDGREAAQSLSEWINEGLKELAQPIEWETEEETEGQADAER
jgi:hypothetical protein